MQTNPLEAVPEEEEVASTAVAAVDPHIEETDVDSQQTEEVAAPVVSMSDLDRVLTVKTVLKYKALV